VIRKRGDKYCLRSKKTGRNLGCYRTRAGAERRERQVQYFKSHPRRREVHVRDHQRRTKAPQRKYVRRDPLEVDEQWDFGEYKLHPLGSRDPELAIRPGDKLYRGTTTIALKGGARAHTGGTLYNEAEWMKGQHRIYMSESAEDAAGYGPLAVENIGGKPVLCEITLTPELFAALKPGYEGAGEWWIAAEAIPTKATRCYILRVDPDTGLPIVPWERFSQ
jgi:hypothetical protein